MSPQTIRVLIAVSLLLHGLAHAVALVSLVADSLGAAKGSRVAVRSWLFRSMSARGAAAVASGLWGLAAAGFLAAAASFWGIIQSGVLWRQLATVSSVVSILGIAVFSGVWPGSPSARRSALNTAIALLFNAAVLMAQLWLHWPPLAMFGK